MKKVEERVRSANLWHNSPTIEEVNSMYEAVADEMFPKKDGERAISWTTYVRQKQPDKKRRRVEVVV